MTGRSPGRHRSSAAEAIVADIEQRLMDPLRNQQTLGVVTFNQKQQTLILDLLDEARRRNPELDRLLQLACQVLFQQGVKPGPGIADCGAV